MLTEVDFYCALKFVAIAQHGHAMQEDNLKMDWMLISKWSTQDALEKIEE